MKNIINTINIINVSTKNIVFVKQEQKIETNIYQKIIIYSPLSYKSYKICSPPNYKSYLLPLFVTYCQRQPSRIEVEKHSFT